MLNEAVESGKLKIYNAIYKNLQSPFVLPKVTKVFSNQFTRTGAT
jgi:hypothetical protein